MRSQSPRCHAARAASGATRARSVRAAPPPPTPPRPRSPCPRPQRPLRATQSAESLPLRQRPEAPRLAEHGLPASLRGAVHGRAVHDHLREGKVSGRGGGGGNGGVGGRVSADDKSEDPPTSLSSAREPTLVPSDPAACPLERGGRARRRPRGRGPRAASLRRGRGWARRRRSSLPAPSPSVPLLRSTRRLLRSRSAWDRSCWSVCGCSRRRPGRPVRCF